MKAQPSLSSITLHSSQGFCLNPCSKAVGLDSFYPPPHGSPEALRSYIASIDRLVSCLFSEFRVRPGCCWAAVGLLNDQCDRVCLQRRCVTLIHRSGGPLGQRAGLLGVVQTCFLGERNGSFDILSPNSSPRRGSTYTVAC